MLFYFYDASEHVLNDSTSFYLHGILKSEEENEKKYQSCTVKILNSFYNIYIEFNADTISDERFLNVKQLILQYFEKAKHQSVEDFGKYYYNKILFF